MHPWHIARIDEVLPRLKKANVTTVTVFLKWGRVEPSPGVFDYSYYLPILDRVVEEGFRLMIRLDAGGGMVLDAEGKVLEPSLAIPPWVRKEPLHRAYDAFGKPTSQLSLFSDSAMDMVAAFYADATATLADRYGDKVVGYAIVFTGEQEIRYGQRKYTWRDFNPAAVREFEERYGHPMPFINFAQRLAKPRPIAGYHVFNQFRAEQLREVVCRLHEVIRSNGGRTVGYFGGFFGPHDGIMLLSAVGEVPDCIDIAVMDYNFMDGWKLNPDPWRMAVMTNYAKNLGYPSVSAGYYVERYRQGDRGFLDEVDPKAFDQIARSVHVTEFDGLEIAGFGVYPREFDGLSSVTLQDAISKPAKSGEGRIKIGILASHETFNFFIADRFEGTNIHNADLVQTFQMFSEAGDFSPVVFSSRTLLHNPGAVEDVDAIYIPHQPILNDDELAFLASFDGAIIQDMRAGSLSVDGDSVGGWQNELFCIDSLSYGNGGFVSRPVEGHALRLERNAGLPVTHAVLTPRSGCEILLPARQDADRGLFLKNGNRLTLGTVPPLIGDEWLVQFTLDQIRSMISD